MRNIISLLFFMAMASGCTQNDNTKTDERKADSALVTADTTSKLHIDTTSASLIINSLEEEGDQGQITFSQNGKTMFYYDQKSNKGKIKLNNVEYVLDKFDFNKNSYKISGNKISINAPNCNFKKNGGEDCGYGKIAVVTVTSGTQSLILKEVEVQDCPNY